MKQTTILSLGAILAACGADPTAYHTRRGNPVHYERNEVASEEVPVDAPIKDDSSPSTRPEIKPPTPIASQPETKPEVTPPSIDQPPVVEPPVVETPEEPIAVLPEPIPSSENPSLPAEQSWKDKLIEQAYKYYLEKSPKFYETVDLIKKKANDGWDYADSVFTWIKSKLSLAEDSNPEQKSLEEFKKDLEEEVRQD